MQITLDLVHGNLIDNHIKLEKLRTLSISLKYTS